MITVEQRFLKFVGPSDTDCLVWTGYINQLGYGRFQLKGRSTQAHRIAWELANGPIPKDLFVLHRCDNRRCVNVDHLFLGTQVDNIYDMIDKGRDRHPRGEASGRSKLTDEAVLAIRKSPETLMVLAARYGVGKSMIGYIKNKQAWRHL